MAIEFLTDLDITFIGLFLAVAVLLTVTLLILAKQLNPKHPSHHHSELEETYTIYPQPSYTAQIVVLFILLSLSFCYFLYEAASISYYSKHITTHISVEEYQSLPLPAVRACIAKSSTANYNETHLTCLFARDGAQSPWDSPCDPPPAIFETERFKCFELNTDGNYTVSNTDTRPSLYFVIYGELCGALNVRDYAVGGVFIVLSFPNASSSPEFNPETTTNGIFASLGMFTHLAITYTKFIPLNGNSTVSITHTNTFMFYRDSRTVNGWPCDGTNSSFMLEFTLNSLDILTTSEMPMASWSDLIPMVGGFIGTFGTMFAFASNNLAKYFHSLRKKKSSKLELDDTELLLDSSDGSSSREHLEKHGILASFQVGNL